MADSSSSGSGCGCAIFCALLFLLFLGLKLGEVGQVAQWDWIWVTAPLWIYAFLVGAFVTVLGFIALIALKYGD